MRTNTACMTSVDCSREPAGNIHHLAVSRVQTEKLVHAVHASTFSPRTIGSAPQDT